MELTSSPNVPTDFSGPGGVAKITRAVQAALKKGMKEEEIERIKTPSKTGGVVVWDLSASREDMPKRVYGKHCGGWVKVAQFVKLQIWEWIETYDLQHIFQR